MEYTQHAGGETGRGLLQIVDAARDERRHGVLLVHDVLDNLAVSLVS